MEIPQQFSRNDKLKAVLFYAMIAIVVAMSIYLLLFIKGESYKCISSPLVYGANHLSASADVYCECRTFGSPVYLMFNGTGMEWSNQRLDSMSTLLNQSI